jgi:hypothetical protein
LRASWFAGSFAVIVTAGGFATAQAAKDATTTIPIVFGVSDDPGQKRPLDFFGPRPFGLLNHLDDATRPCASR